MFSLDRLVPGDPHKGAPFPRVCVISESSGGFLAAVPCNLARNPPQDSHIRAFQPGSSEEATQAMHHVAGIAFMQKADRPQGCLQLAVHRLGLFDRRQGRNSRGLEFQVADEELIAHNHYGLCEIDAVRPGLGRDPQEHLTAHDVVIDETRIFRTKDDTDLPMCRVRQDQGRQGAGTARLLPVAAGLPRSADDKADAAQGGAERAIGACQLEHRVAAARHPERLLVDAAFRPDETELADSHVVHGSGDRAQVSGIFDANQYDHDIVQHRHFRGQVVNITLKYDRLPHGNAGEQYSRIIGRTRFAGGKMARARFAAVIALILLAGVLPAQKQEQKPAKKELQPEEIIKAFTNKETQFLEAWNQYYYRQIATVKVLSDDGVPSNEAMTLVFEVVFLDNGTRSIKLIERSGRLRSVLWTTDDEDVITNYQPFALTAKDLPLYDLNYEGKEKVDELDTHVFSVKPKTIQSGKLYFQGKIWIDDADLQIVRTMGRVVPQKESPQFPEFETIRQLVDKKYWFPVWSHADSVLEFTKPTPRRVRVEETITYAGFKRFTSSVTVKPVKK